MKDDSQKSRGGESGRKGRRYKRREGVREVVCKKKEREIKRRGNTKRGKNERKGSLDRGKDAREGKKELREKEGGRKIARTGKE